MATTSVEAFGFGGSGYDPVMSFVEGSVNQYFDKKSEKRALKRQLQLMDAQYNYAQRYAENSPTWNVKGLRDAGLNPILAVSNGANLGATIPSAPSVASHKPTASNSQGGFTYDPLTRSQLKVNEASIRNLDAQAEASKLNSISQAKEREANTVLRLLEGEQRKKSNYSFNLIRDAHSLVLDFLKSSKDYIKLWRDSADDSRNPSSFIKHGPDPIHDRNSDARSKAYEKTVDREWLSRPNKDGLRFHRKSGDTPGVMHMYR